MIPALNRFSSAALSSRSYADVSHRVFVTPRRVRFVESEYAVPRESLLHVLGELRRQVPRLADPVMFPVEVRVAAADDIWLSTAYGRDTAYVAIHQYTGLPYRSYFDLFESIVADVEDLPGLARGGDARSHPQPGHTERNAPNVGFKRADEVTVCRYPPPDGGNGTQ